VEFTTIPGAVARAAREFGDAPALAEPGGPRISHRELQERAFTVARAGSGVVLASRSAPRCRQAAAGLSAETGRTVQGRGCDVTDERAVANLVDQVIAEHGRLDVLVTSAGVQARGTLEQLDVAAFRACLEVNVVGTWLACRAAVAPMRAAGYGRILTLPRRPGTAAR
jgi:NAD(P)-dependent dehydrogenase (short-subunit alcohol dehydrogenase family)